MKNATADVLNDIIRSNLASLDRILEYNIQNGIKLFRISSDIIPFGSHPVNTLKWWEEFSDILKMIGNKALVNGIRLSMHPGQYTVLNSPDEAVADRAVEDLKYHCRFLDAMGLGAEHKIILHIGGIYGDKKAAARRFIQNHRCLDSNIRCRLVIENDDRQYTISDVLSIGKDEGIPVVFDNLHHQVNPDNILSEGEWIVACRKTWKQKDGPQKLHYSQQDKDKRSGSHSATLDVSEFAEFYRSLPKQDTDIMVEVKDKNLSSIKCINVISPPKIKRLEKEWERYKYLVLEHSPKNYNEIRQLLKDKDAYPLFEFYRLIDESMKTPVTSGNAVNAASHVWGYFKDLADDKARSAFQKNIDKVSQGGSARHIKHQLFELTKIHKQQYLLDSLYFMELDSIC
jgi:UV DNA damage endonuclease